MVRALLAILFASVAAGCDSANPSIESKDVPDTMVIYSLDFEAFEAEKVPKDGEAFHGYPIFGKLEVSNTAEKSEIAAALRDHMDRKGLAPAKCFMPRHGVRFIKDNITTDYLVCFQCQQYQKWVDNKSSEGGLIGPEPETAIDRILTVANVKLAPKAPGQ